LQRSYDLVKQRGYQVVNIDATLCLEQPKIKPYVEQMRNVIASILTISVDDVSIKATTTETMGFVGRQEGLVAYANVLLQLV
jgi:2-C-methyl-D-erythritol 2,4-cyclodiphosphate synthase